MKNFFYIFFIITVFYCNTFSQSKSVKENGWQIPDTRILKLRNEETKTIGDILIDEKIFDITDKKLRIFVAITKNLGTKQTRFWEVRDAKSYSRKNKIFAYYFSYVPFVVSEYKANKNTKVKTEAYLGSMFSLYYVDDDGDGVFETRYSAYKTALELPNWVKNIK